MILLRWGQEQDVQNQDLLFTLKFYNMDSYISWLSENYLFDPNAIPGSTFLYGIFLLSFPLQISSNHISSVIGIKLYWSTMTKSLEAIRQFEMQT